MNQPTKKLDNIERKLVLMLWRKYSKRAVVRWDPGRRLGSIKL